MAGGYRGHVAPCFCLLLIRRLHLHLAIGAVRIPDSTGQAQGELALGLSAGKAVFRIGTDNWRLSVGNQVLRVKVPVIADCRPNLLQPVRIVSPDFQSHPVRDQLLFGFVRELKDVVVGNGPDRSIELIGMTLFHIHQGTALRAFAGRNSTAGMGRTAKPTKITIPLDISSRSDYLAMVVPGKQFPIPLFHAGLRGLFPLIREAVATVLPVEKLRYIALSHTEADESGALNDWLDAAPYSAPVCGTVAAMVSIGDLADRFPRALADGELLPLDKPDNTGVYARQRVARRRGTIA